MPLYFGQAGGAQVVAYGTGITQVGDDHQISLTTWDLYPAGIVGDVYVRSIDVAGVADNGYAITVTPIVDDVELTAQTFTSSATGPFQCQAFVAKRGTAVRARVETTSLTGSVEMRDIACSLVVIRQTP